MKSRFRLRLRTLLALPFAFAIYFALRTTHPEGTWLGGRDVTLRFVVVEAGGPSARPARSLTTGPDGQARLTETFTATGGYTPSGVRGRVIMPRWTVRVSAAGYEPSQPLPLVEEVGRSRDIDDPNPPPVRVPLRPRRE